MFWSDTVLCSGFTGWWWLIPVVCIILCMVFCRGTGQNMAGRRWCCGRSHHSDDINELRKEVQDLKERINDAK